MPIAALLPGGDEAVAARVAAAIGWARRTRPCPRRPSQRCARCSRRRAGAAARRGVRRRALGRAHVPRSRRVPAAPLERRADPDPLHRPRRPPRRTPGLVARTSCRARAARPTRRSARSSPTWRAAWRRPTPVIERLHTAAGGNPLFAEEMLRMLLDEEALERQNGGWRLRRDLDSVPMPPTINALLAAAARAAAGGAAERAGARGGDRARLLGAGAGRALRRGRSRGRSARARARRRDPGARQRRRRRSGSPT